MRVGVTGSTGFLGTALVGALEARGDDVVRFVRPDTTAVSGAMVRWDPARSLIDEGDLAAAGGFDAVVNLAGTGIASHRWSDAYRRRVLTSRTDATSLLVRALTTLTSGVAVLVSASAVGYYGDRGDEVLDESSAGGEDYVAQVCREWEAAAAPFAATGASLSIARTGIVLGRSGGVLERLTPLFRAGAGGVIGNGRQWVSPISLVDEVAALLWLIDHQSSGVFNLVAPEPCTNREMTRTLARQLHRPAVLRVPSLALRLTLGRELADNTVLTSQRVVPTALEASGFTFSSAGIESIIASALT
ncbi:MAG: TIGR01777 family oxidoreductase [Acidobacteriota bacterium]|nr:TIGR01777 family oxidoreductase [Acidobacteriota bacterium]